ncbi:MAG: hypothetical protein C0507_20175 [Cyanobacteria bacterium PR.3.49]|nr:hypothetical protein [Cyanobacteria bacterium PR.3.49]
MESNGIRTVTGHRKSTTEILVIVSCLSGLLAPLLPAQALPYGCAHNAAVNTVSAGEADGEGEDASKPKKKGYAEEAVKHYNRGVEFHQNGDLNQAIKAYKEAILADGRLAEAYSNLGAVYLAQKSYDKAAEAFSKALALKPDRPTTLNGLGNALYARGKAAEAKDKWAKAIEIDPNFASAYYNMGNALESEKDDKAAIGEYMKAIGANPKMADAYYRIGGILHKTKHPAQANVFLKKSMELAPNADFQRDAVKMIKEEETEFTREVDSAQVETTASPASKETGTAKKTASDSAVAAAEKKTTSTAPDKVTPDGKDKAPRFPLFKRKAKEEKKVEMFVQPPSATQDLKPSPADNPAPESETQSSSDAWK